MNDTELDNVTGGAGANTIIGGPLVSPQEKQRMEQFSQVWRNLGFSATGRTSHEMEGLFEKWKANNYQPAAELFLGSMKDATRP